MRADGTRETAHINLRAVFSAPRGWCMLSADYRQVELRLMAHLAGEAGLQQVFSDGLVDPFTRMAADVRGKAEAAVTAAERAEIKQAFYGLLYGMGAKMLATKLGCDVNTAATLRQRLLTQYPRVCPSRSAPPAARCVCAVFVVAVARMDSVPIQPTGKASDGEGRWRLCERSARCGGLRACRVWLYGGMLFGMNACVGMCGGAVWLCGIIEGHVVCVLWGDSVACGADTAVAGGDGAAVRGDEVRGDGDVQAAAVAAGD